MSHSMPSSSSIPHHLSSSSTTPTRSSPTVGVADPLEALYQQGITLRTTRDYENSFKCLNRAAQLGHMRAIFAVGWAYYQGLGMEIDLEKAMGHFQQAAQFGNDNDAAYYLAQCCIQRNEVNGSSATRMSHCSNIHQTGTMSPSSSSSSPSSSSTSNFAEQSSFGVVAATIPFSGADSIVSSGGGNNEVGVNFAMEAMTWYLVAARRGHALSQYRLGMFYMEGYGVEPDPVIALQYLLQAAEQQYAEAEYRVGQCYEHGIGTEVDLALAYQWYLKAVHHNNALAQFRLGQWYAEGKAGFLDKQPVQACQLHTLAAEQGYLPAQLNLGWCHRYGVGTEVSMEKAVYWYSKAADQGSPAAQDQLAFCLINGLGVDRNEGQGVEFYKKAANQGYIEAQFNLACCYRDGIGIQQNPALAAHWFEQAAKHGDHQAMNNLGWCYRLGFGVEQNDQRAFQWYMDAAIERDSIACANVAYYYRHGIGVELSLSKAIEWYQIAAEANDAIAQYELGCLLYHAVDLGLDGKNGLVRDQDVESSGYQQRSYEQLLEGISWLQRAASQGSEKAMQKLQEIAKGDTNSSHQAQSFNDLDLSTLSQQPQPYPIQQLSFPSEALTNIPGIDDPWVTAAISRAMEEMSSRYGFEPQREVGGDSGSNGGISAEDVTGGIMYG